MSFRRSPPSAAILRALELPTSGGDTLFANMRDVWARLPEEVKAACRPLQASHDIAKWLRGGAAEAARQVCPVIAHPIVRLHPETGEEVLWVNYAYTTAVVGMAKDDSTLLLDYLFRQVMVPEVQCRIRWQQGTMVLWDNCLVQHYACGDYFPARRVMERISLAGGEV